LRPDSEQALLGEFNNGKQPAAHLAKVLNSQRAAVGGSRAIGRA
jgi:hypothetical protein